MRNPALPATFRHDEVRVCQYCDREVRGEAHISTNGHHAATLCSHSCKTLYERATAKQGILPLGWDVT